MRPGADRDFWVAAWVVAIAFLVALFTYAASDEFQRQRPRFDAGARLAASKHPGALVPASHDVEPPRQFVTHQELDDVASIVAMRPYSIHCPTAEAWADDPLSEIAWGYTMLVWDFAVLNPMLCEAALDVGVEEISDDWARALSVSVLIHEAYHGRRWGGRANEAKVECKAIRHWTVGMQMLGGGDEEIGRLKGWALAMHWRLARLADEYYLPSCDVPNPW